MWLIDVRDMTHSYIWHDSWTYVTWLHQICQKSCMNESWHTWKCIHDSNLNFMYSTRTGGSHSWTRRSTPGSWLFQVCHDSFIWLFWHDFFIFVMTHPSPYKWALFMGHDTYEKNMSHVVTTWHDSLYYNTNKLHTWNRKSISVSIKWAMWMGRHIRQSHVTRCDFVKWLSVLQYDEAAHLNPKVDIIFYRMSHINE